MAEMKSKVEEGRRPMTWFQLLAEFRQTMMASMGDQVPAEFLMHMHSSHKERLLAMRSLLDARIEHLEQMEEQAKERKATKISIE